MTTSACMARGASATARAGAPLRASTVADLRWWNFQEWQAMLWNELKRKRYAEDLAYRQRRRASNAASWRKHKYGLSPQEYYALVARQGGACAICRKIKPLCVDHCHLTGKVRGLLCHTCNSALGFWGDSPSLVRRALKYLETAGRDAGGRRREWRVIRTGSRTKKPARRGAGRRRSPPGRYQRVAKPGLRRYRIGDAITAKNH
jgi:hypothetical protein